MGVNAKLKDPGEGGWKILKAPTEKFPATVVIEKGVMKMVINLAYEMKTDMTTSASSSALKAEPTALYEMISEPDDEPSYKLYLDDDNDEVEKPESGFSDEHVTLRRSKRMRKPVTRLSLGLGNSKSYDK
ncbi:hypothetical protein FOZ61_001279 [Perkinsus olseni]|uniref:Uncharacterized protein n=1 Tax=Perkinsus olseni TaxID=32597 RepID=A0A7J6MCT5_PEROL|nr:hypothetical protein FOZ61_001279 [Perkinsus olseni]KAF4669379.1 hypothetical protein FOL46_001471 [Perkinsus olseni]